LRPAEAGFRLDVEIDFKSEAIGRQRKILDLDPAGFRRELAGARTFGFLADVKRLIAAGFALGASLENSVGIDDDRVVNPEGLRYSDEFVRHKMLDAVGDLALAGAPLIGEYRSYCGGHKMNVAVLGALFADRTAYRFVDAIPAPREGARADLGLVASPVFMPERN
jgi:UDP-3-O-[3-hydroxymyristoyl] N-acetylglucosamine deacetylase